MNKNKPIQIICIIYTSELAKKLDEYPNMLKGSCAFYFFERYSIYLLKKEGATVLGNPQLGIVVN